MGFLPGPERRRVRREGQVEDDVGGEARDVAHYFIELYARSQSLLNWL